jgi:hypothetical protein
MNQLSVNNINSLTAYVDNLNERAKEQDLRNLPFVPPKGTVLTVSCDNDNHARIGVANGMGGVVHHQMPPGVFFTCHRLHDVKKPKPWKFTLWLERKVGIRR